MSSSLAEQNTFFNVIVETVMERLTWNNWNIDESRLITLMLLHVICHLISTHVVSKIQENLQNYTCLWCGAKYLSLLYNITILKYLWYFFNNLTMIWMYITSIIDKNILFYCIGITNELYSYLDVVINVDIQRDDESCKTV